MAAGMRVVTEMETKEVLRSSRQKKQSVTNSATIFASSHALLPSRLVLPIGEPDNSTSSPRRPSSALLTPQLRY